MSLNLITIKCPKCGNENEIIPGLFETECDFCGATLQTGNADSNSSGSSSYLDDDPFGNEEFSSPPPLPESSPFETESFNEKPVSSNKKKKKSKATEQRYSTPTPPPPIYNPPSTNTQRTPRNNSRPATPPQKKKTSSVSLIIILSFVFAPIFIILQNKKSKRRHYKSKTRHTKWAKKKRILSEKKRLKKKLLIEKRKRLIEKKHILTSNNSSHFETSIPDVKTVATSVKVRKKKENLKEKLKWIKYRNKHGKLISSNRYAKFFAFLKKRKLPLLGTGKSKLKVAIFSTYHGMGTTFLLKTIKRIKLLKPDDLSKVDIYFLPHMYRKNKRSWAYESLIDVYFRNGIQKFFSFHENLLKFNFLRVDPKKAVKNAASASNIDLTKLKSSYHRGTYKKFSNQILPVPDLLGHKATDSFIVVGQWVYDLYSVMYLDSILKTHIHEL